MKCYASDYCQKDKSSCSDVCGGYRVLRALYNLSRIPERYRYTIALKPENGEDLEAFTVLDNYKNDVLSMVDEGRGLYIWGKSTIDRVIDTVMRGNHKGGVKAYGSK